jgi:hypothetical protein
MDDAIDLASISEDWSTVAVFSRNFYHISVMDRTSEQITWSSSLPPDAYSDKNIKRDPFLRNVGVDLSSNGSAVTYTRGIKKGSDGTRYALVTIVDVKTGRQKQVTVPLKSVKLDTVCMTPRGDVLVFFPEGILQIRHSPASVDLIFDKSVGTAADAEVDTTTSIVTIGCNDGLVIRKHLSWLNQFGKLPDN